MSNFLCQLLRTNSRGFLRNFQHVRYMFQKGAYEGDGRTTVTILNTDADYGLMIDKITLHGFQLNIGMNVLGPMIIFPKTVIGWNIVSVEDINENSLSLFKVLTPKPDICILGLDKDYPRESTFLHKFQNVLKELNITYEVLPVEKACTTFNFLNAEKRYAVAALLPPRDIGDISESNLIEMGVKRYLHGPWKRTDDESSQQKIDTGMQTKSLYETYNPDNEEQKSIPENVPPSKTNQ